MDATEIPRKSSCLLAEPDRPLFAPLSSRMELFHRPNTAFYTFREREPLRIKEGASERIADIDCSRAERSRAKQSLINRRHRHQIRGRRRRPLLLSFLTDQTAVRCCMVLYCPMPCCLFRIEKEEREEKEREREKERTTAWQPRRLSSQGTVVQYNLPPFFLGNATTSSRCRSTQCPAGRPSVAKKTDRWTATGRGRGREGLSEPPGGQQFTLQLACRFCYLDNSSRSS